jgi:hypothetical protein
LNKCPGAPIPGLSANRSIQGNHGPNLPSPTTDDDGWTNSSSKCITMMSCTVNAEQGKQSRIEGSRIEGLQKKHAQVDLCEDQRGCREHTSN